MLHYEPVERTIFPCSIQCYTKMMMFQNELLSEANEREHAFTQERILFIRFISYLVVYEAVGIPIYTAERYSNLVDWYACKVVQARRLLSGASCCTYSCDPFFLAFFSVMTHTIDFTIVDTLRNAASQGEHAHVI